MIQTHSLEMRTGPGVGVFDITEEASRIVVGSGVGEGVCVIFAVGSTCAITTLEFEGGLVSDLGDALERLFPEEIGYEHEKRWHDGNGHSHTRASFLGQSLVVPVSRGSLVLGTWQQVVFVELDNKKRTRKIVVQVWGEPP